MVIAGKLQSFARPSYRIAVAGRVFHAVLSWHCQAQRPAAKAPLAGDSVD
jgi:hypothetical protein